MTLTPRWITPRCDYVGCDSEAEIRVLMTLTAVDPHATIKDHGVTTRVYCAFHLDELLAGQADVQDDA